LIQHKRGRFLDLESIASEIKEVDRLGGFIAIRFAVVPMKTETHQFGYKITWAPIEQVPFLLVRESLFGHFDITFQQRGIKTIFLWQGNQRRAMGDGDK